MYYVYVIRSEVDKKFYTGFSEDVFKRLEQHNSGLVTSTKRRVPFRLVYYEASVNINDAMHREKYLKTTYGKRYIKTRIKNFLNY
jgi:putative endonuclease